MGVRRYSRDPTRRRWQERFDELNRAVNIDVYAPKVGELMAFGVTQAEWHCNARGACLHRSEPFELSRFGRDLRTTALRRLYVCSACGTKWPRLVLLAD